MIWLWSAVGAHAANALVFVADKGLLKSKTVMGNPARYTFFSGLSAGVAIVLLPWVRYWPSAFMVTWSVIAGGLHLAALWSFFIVLQRKESSRVVPLVGAAVPMWTLILAALFLQERLGGLAYAGSLCLIAGGAFLSFSFQKGWALTSRDWALVLVSGFFFAAYFTSVKHLYDNSPAFLAAFTYGRLVEAIMSGFLVWSVIDPNKPTRKSPRQKGNNRKANLAFVSNKSLAAGAFMLQSYAIRMGSVTVVNALQGVQYVFLLILAGLASSRWPKIYNEEISRVSITQKLIGISVVSAGLIILIYA